MSDERTVSQASRTSLAVRCARACLGLGVTLIAFAATSQPATAHPHVWVVARATLVVENGSVVAVRHRWAFDEGYTKMAIDGLDKNGDGIYDRQELDELAQVNVEGLKEFDYFTQARLGATKLANGAPRDAHLEHDRAGVLSLHFTLALSKPVLLEAADFAIAVGDPSVFIDFRFDKADPVTLSGAPPACKAALSTPEAAAEATAKLGQAFAGEMQGLVNITVPQEIRITCAG